jgi:hypothetical protein
MLKGWYLPRCFGLWLLPLSGLLCPSSTAAECRLPLFARQHLHTLQSSEEGLGKYNEGLLFLDNRCFDESVSAFEAAVRHLQAETGRNVHRDELLGLSEAGLALASAHRTFQAGGKESAVAAMLSILREREASVVTLRAALTLAEEVDPKSPEWTGIQGELEILANLGYWKAQKALSRRLLAVGRSQEAIASVERRLSRTDKLQESHVLRILLADTWLAAGRSLEAWLLIQGLEPAAGEEILDWEVRMEFLRVAAEVARARAKNGDLDASRRAPVYETALKEFLPQ